MNIGGLQKTSLLDYPDTISAIIWTAGCNFRCPFCYNKDLVLGNVENISEKDIFSFLEKRKDMLEGLVISGGEPLMQKDIVPFAEKVKKLGYKIKIDTNGMYPEKLKELKVDTVIVTGFCAEYCVLSTYRGAQDFDLNPIILKGSLASDNAEHIRFVEEITEIISYGALKTLL